LQPLPSVQTIKTDLNGAGKRAEQTVKTDLNALDGDFQKVRGNVQKAEANVKAKFQQVQAGYKALPPEKKMGVVAAGAGIGVAVLAGTIGGMVNAANSHHATPAPQTELATLPPKVVEVAVKVPVAVQTPAMQAELDAEAKLAALPPPPVQAKLAAQPPPQVQAKLFAKGAASEEKPKPVVSKSVLVGVAGFVAVGFVVLGISGLAYYKLGQTAGSDMQTRTFSKLSREASEEEEGLVDVDINGNHWQ